MKLRYKILFVAIALIGLSSCKDFLEKVPDTRVYLVNLDQLEQLLITGYTQHNYAVIGELSSDNCDDTNSPDKDGNRYNYSAYNRYDEQIFSWQDVDLDISDSDTPSGLWESCYSAIAVANAVIEKADEFEQTGEIEGQPMTVRDKARLRAIQGEAHMIRAYHHYILAQLFCMPYRGPEISKTLPGIPYASEPETELYPMYDRGTLQETYDKIEADLLIGLANVSDEFYDVPKYHFNVASSNSFAARFYLAKREYDKVVKYATAAFKGNDPATMRNDFWDKQEDFIEWEDGARYYTSIDRPGNFMLFDTYTTWFRRWGCRFFSNRDGYHASISGPGPSWSGDYMPFFRNSVLGSPVYPEYGFFFYGTYMEQFEYTDKLAGIGYPHMVRPEFTSQETLLFRAEAYLFLGDIDAAFADLYEWNHEHIMQGSMASSNGTMSELEKDRIVSFYSYYDNPKRRDPGYGIVKKFHIDEVCPSDKYHLTNEIEPYLNCVQHFRRMQNAHLGQRWFDIKRYGFSITHKMGKDNVYTLEVLDPRYAIQIPAEVIGAGLTPNPRKAMPETQKNGFVVVGKQGNNNGGKN